METLFLAKLFAKIAFTGVDWRLRLTTVVFSNIVPFSNDRSIAFIIFENRQMESNNPIQGTQNRVVWFHLESVGFEKMFSGIWDLRKMFLVSVPLFEKLKSGFLNPLVILIVSINVVQNGVLLLYLLLFLWKIELYFLPM